MGYTRINYIDTDFLSGGVVAPIELNDDALEFRADVFFKQYGYNNSEAPVFSAEPRSNILFLRLNSDGRTRAYWGGADSGSYGNFRLAGTRRLITFRKGVFCIDGQAYEYSPVASLGDFVGKGYKPLFGMKYAGSPAKVYYYSYQVLKSGRLVFDGVPVLAPSGTIGAFDFVSRTFVPDTNQSHIAGLTLAHVRRLRLPKVSTHEGASPPTLTLALPWQAEFDSQAQSALHAAIANGWLLSIRYEPIPGFDGYVRAAYLKSTGQQWINTGLTGLTKDSFVEFRGVAQGLAKRAYQMHGFALTGLDSSLRRAFVNIAYPDLTNVLRGYIPLNETIPHKVDAKHHVGTICLNGTEFTLTDIVESEGSEPLKPTILRLFSYYDPSLYTGTRWVGTCEHFRSKMSNGEVYFIPAIDPNGTPCMFDLVSKKPYYDAGTSGVPFIVGLTKEQAETLVLGDKASGITIAVPKGTDTATLQANNPNITITIQNT
jgi:hypothetical protein